MNTEDRTWRNDPIHLERERVVLADLHGRCDAISLWLAFARDRVAQIEREVKKARTAELGRYEPNDNPE